MQVVRRLDPTVHDFTLHIDEIAVKSPSENAGIGVFRFRVGQARIDRRLRWSHHPTVGAHAIVTDQLAFNIVNATDFDEEILKLESWEPCEVSTSKAAHVAVRPLMPTPASLQQATDAALESFFTDSVILYEGDTLGIAPWSSTVFPAPIESYAAARQRAASHAHLAKTASSQMGINVAKIGENKFPILNGPFGLEHMDAWTREPAVVYFRVELIKPADTPMVPVATPSPTAESEALKSPRTSNDGEPLPGTHAGKPPLPPQSAPAPAPHEQAVRRCAELIPGTYSLAVLPPYQSTTSSNGRWFRVPDASDEILRMVRPHWFPQLLPCPPPSTPSIRPGASVSAEEHDTAKLASTWRSCWRRSRYGSLIDDTASPPGPSDILPSLPFYRRGGAEISARLRELMAIRPSFLPDSAGTLGEKPAALPDRAQQLVQQATGGRASQDQRQEAVDAAMQSVTCWYRQQVQSNSCVVARLKGLAGGGGARVTAAAAGVLGCRTLELNFADMGEAGLQRSCQQAVAEIEAVLEESAPVVVYVRAMGARQQLEGVQGDPGSSVAEHAWRCWVVASMMGRVAAWNEKVWRSTAGVVMHAGGAGVDEGGLDVERGVGSDRASGVAGGGRGPAAVDESISDEALAAAMNAPSPVLPSDHDSGAANGKDAAVSGPDAAAEAAWRAMIEGAVVVSLDEYGNGQDSNTSTPRQRARTSDSTPPSTGSPFGREGSGSGLGAGMADGAVVRGSGAGVEAEGGGAEVRLPVGLCALVFEDDSDVPETAPSNILAALIPDAIPLPALSGPDRVDLLLQGWAEYLLDSDWSLETLDSLQAQLRDWSHDDILNAAFASRRHALARAVKQIEDRQEESRKMLRDGVGRLDWLMESSEEGAGKGSGGGQGNDVKRGGARAVQVGESTLHAPGDTTTPATSPTSSDDSPLAEAYVAAAQVLTVQTQGTTSGLVRGTDDAPLGRSVRSVGDVVYFESCLSDVLLHPDVLLAAPEEQRLQQVARLAARAHITGSNAGDLEGTRMGPAAGRLKDMEDGGDGAEESGADKESWSDNVWRSAALTLQDFVAGRAEIQSSQSVKTDAPQIPNTRWDDIGGLEHVKRAITHMIQLPQTQPHLFGASGFRLGGVLLYGPPGTGKTLIAKAVATECGLAFMNVKGPELLDMYIGESERNVREVFAKARAAAPCVVFFDELDSLAPRRGNAGDSAAVTDRLVSQLVAELDALSDHPHVFVLGATNRPDLLDPALLGPGRFDKLEYLGVNQSPEGRAAVLRAATRRYTLGPDVDFKTLAAGAPGGMTGADLAAVARAAARIAVDRRIVAIKQFLDEWNTTALERDRDADQVTAPDFHAAFASCTPSIRASELAEYEAVRMRISGNS